MLLALSHFAELLALYNKMYHHSSAQALVFAIRTASLKHPRYAFWH